MTYDTRKTSQGHLLVGHTSTEKELELNAVDEVGAAEQCEVGK